MLKNKRLLILLIMVILIWGVIGYKVYKHLEGDSVIDIQRPPRTMKQELPKESMRLSLKYADPFLKNVIVKKGVEKRSILTAMRKQSVKATTTSVPVHIDWSRLKYFGMMRNSSRQLKTGIVRVDNNDVFVREGEQVDIFTILDIGVDSIKVKHSLEIKYIRKEN